MKRLGKLLQSQDWYGEEVGLKLFGLSKFTSPFGGAISVLAKIALLLYISLAVQ